MSRTSNGREGALVLVRHGQSSDNEANLFSGWRDPELTLRGMEEARAAGSLLRRQGIRFDRAFTSTLRRARDSLILMLAELDQADLPFIADQSLKERDYGELSGLNKDGARAVWGDEQVRLWRKSYSAVPPGGESLAMTVARMLPFWRQQVEPYARRGERILVVAHGNSLRSIVTYLEEMAPEDILGVHIETSGALIYDAKRAGPFKRRALLGADVSVRPHKH